MAIAVFLMYSCFHTSSQQKITKAQIDSIRAERDSTWIAGRSQMEQSSFTDAVMKLTTALDLSKDIKDTSSIIQIHNQLGIIAKKMGRSDEALRNHYQAFQLAFSNQDTSYQSLRNKISSISNLGSIFLEIGNIDKAEEYFKMAVQMEAGLKEDKDKAINHGNLGNVYEVKGMLDSALVQYQLSMEYNKLAGSQQGIGICHIHYGDIAYQNGDVETAISEYNLAIQSLTDNFYRKERIDALQRLSSIYLFQKRYPEAKHMIDHSFTDAKALGRYDYLYDATLLLANYEEKMNNLRNALDYYHLGYHYLDSLNWIEQETEAAVRELSIEHERKTNLEQLNSIQTAHNNLKKAKQAESILFFISVLLFLITIVLLFAMLRTRKLRIEEMLKNNSVRNAFFTNITHEFRTPITIIKGMAELLRDADHTRENRQAHLETIERQSNILLRLVEKLLCISKMSVGSDPNQEWRHGDIISFIRMVCALYKDYAESLHISLKVFTKEEKIEMDYVPYYYDRIISNLLSNAFKFTPADGYIQITMDSSKDNMILTFEDSGIGISHEDQKQIFDIFFQGSNTNGQHGSGIGLAYVRQMVVSMGGTIDVSNRTDGKGLKTTMTLPKKCPDTTKEITPYNIEDDYQAITHYVLQSSYEVINVPDKQSDRQSPSEDLNRPTIMIVEDNRDVISYIEELLGKEYRIISASDGYDALSKANQTIPDLVITDVMMPGLDGFKLCRTIRKHELMADIPVIICSAKIEEKDRIEGLESGADYYITKPINSQELKETVKRLISERTQSHAEVRQAIQDVAEGKPMTYAETDREFIDKLNNLVKSKMMSRKIQVEDIADAIGMGKSTLNRKIRLLTGVSTSAYILQIRIEEACRLLRETDSSIGDVSVSCGFESLSYFSRVFHQNIEMTPSEYRQKERKLS